MRTKEALQSIFVNPFLGAIRLFQSEPAKEKLPVEPIHRLLIVGRHIAQIMGAFDENVLNLLSEEETFFSQRLSLALLTEFSPECPWSTPYLPQERMAAACYYDLLYYVEENSNIEITFSQDEDPYGRCIKRAMDYAAVKAVATMTAYLRQTGQLPQFSYEFQNYCTMGSLGVFPLTLRELPLYEPSPTANDKFKQIFAEYGDDIISFRNLQTKPGP